MLSAQAGAAGEEATVVWMCETDGSQSPNDMEAHSCQWHEDVLRPCRSCLVSNQNYRQSRCVCANKAAALVAAMRSAGADADGKALSDSGVLLMTEEYQCMQTKFTVEEGSSTGRRLCPGEYTVRGCETNEFGTCEIYFRWVPAIHYDSSPPSRSCWKTRLKRV